MKRKIWLITGISSGFGYELTKQLLEKGDVVIGTVRNQKKIGDFLEKYPETFHDVILDVTNVSQIHQVVDSSFEKFRISMLS